MNPNMVARWFEDALVAGRFVYFYTRAEALHPQMGFQPNGAPRMTRRQRAAWAFNKSLGRV